MAFFEGRLDTCVRYGYSGGATFLTSIVSVNSGAEERNGLWANGRGKWDVEYVYDQQGMAALQRFFKARQGMLQGFRFKDWLDFTDEDIGYLVDNPALNKMNMVKKYRTDTAPYYIRKPVTATFYKNGAEITGTMDTTTGEVTFPTTEVQVASFTSAGANTDFTTSVAHGLVNNQKVSFSGFTLGLSVLNGVVYTATVVSPTVFRIQQTTTGYTGVVGKMLRSETTVTGAEYKWKGEFDKTVRFDTDSFVASITDKDIYSINNLPIIEIKDYK